MTETNVNYDNEARARDWAPVLLSTGFHMSSAMSLAMGMCAGRANHMAIRNVQNLLLNGCKDSQEWQNAIDTLLELYHAHPDREQSSGGWFHASSSTPLAMAAAIEAARAAKMKLYPDLYPEGHIEGSQFAVLKYLLQAFAKDPTKAAEGLAWLEHNLNVRYPEKAKS